MRTKNFNNDVHAQMYLFIKEPVCDTDDDKRLTEFKTPLRLRAGGVIN